ncbi:MAG TPA: VPLPA-CTERM sorting domain-containing protein, partial [Acetobacteraceae bacterium]|nr:VPLPA-CTERM sorting domain-containing protein [Acetobacteraceae bacterium]
VSAGNHVLQLISLEDCCDGAVANGRFEIPKAGNFVYFGSDDGLSTRVPEPASLVLLGGSLIGLGAIGRRKRG